ncbi:MAG: hypothetical protein Q7R83_02725 [bacterium]|nr:hypothetical protein [bacterium]
MEPKIVERRVERAHPLQRVLLTFMDGQQGIEGLIQLLRIRANNEITMDDLAYGIVLAVVLSRKWDRPQNRQVSVNFQPTRNASWIGRLIGPHLEQMEVYTPHAVKPIMTSRQMKREEAADTIIKTVLTVDLLEEARGWDMKITGELDASEQGLRTIVFMIMPGTVHVKTIVLDGWSGRTFIDGVGSETMVTDLATVTALLQRQITTYVEQATA